MRSMPTFSRLSFGISQLHRRPHPPRALGSYRSSIVSSLYHGKIFASRPGSHRPGCSNSVQVGGKCQPIQHVSIHPMGGSIRISSVPRPDRLYLACLTKVLCERVDCSEGPWASGQEERGGRRDKKLGSASFYTGVQKTWFGFLLYRGP